MCILVRGCACRAGNAVGNETGERIIDSTAELEDVRVPIYSKQSARATSIVNYQSNLDQSVDAVPPGLDDEAITQYIQPFASDKRGHVSTINVYDNLGNEREMRLEFYKEAENQWRARVFLDDSEGLTVNTVQADGTDTLAGAANNFAINFNPDGSIASLSDGTDLLDTGALRVQLNFQLASDPNPQTLELDFGEAGTISGITQFAGEFSTRASSQDGIAMGYLESFAIDNSGTVVGSFSNGVKEPLAQVAMAIFTNPEGLRKEGETKFSYTLNSGDPNIGVAAQNGRGKINAGVLEMSNVDLAEEFTNMIVTQRGFQANSRTITTTDQMLQELLTLKR